MQKEIIIAGFGGQGVLFAGQIIAYSAMDVGKEVTWIPSYGPEMRGGTANCTVVLADEEIGSPLVKHPPLAVALNLPSFDKCEESLAPGGTLIVNQSMVELLSTCPTNWGMTPVDSLKFVEQHMMPAFPLGDYKVSAGIAQVKV